MTPSFMFEAFKKAFVGVLVASLCLTVALTLAGCKMNEEETRARIKQQNDDFTWEAKPEWEDAVRPKNQ